MSIARIRDDGSSSVPLLGTDSPPPDASFLYSGATRSRRPTLLHLVTTLSLPVLVVILLSLTSTSRSTSDPLAEWIHRNASNVNVFEPLTIVSRNKDVQASFIALGASLNEFLVRDKDGNWRDLIVGCKDPRDSVSSDVPFAYFGAVVGRYANRISRHSFPALAPNHDELYTLPINEGNSTTLHGGKWGYSRSGWKVISHERDRVVFSLIDRNGTEGFPGTVETLATYQVVSSPPRLITTFKSRVTSSLATPISLSSHVYWNLDGYGTIESNERIGGGMKMWIDSNRTVEIDQELIPTGRIVEIEPRGPLDFHTRGNRQERALEEGIKDPRARGLCGPNCQGLDNALVYSNTDRDFETDIVMSLSSPNSGIRMSVRTNQPLVHLYTCNSDSFASTNGSYPIKRTQRLGQTEPSSSYGKWSCVAIEQEGWIDGVHHVEQWNLVGNHSQWYDETREYVWWSEYEFSTDA
ncbi:uncharacterized protein JCM15063_001622 [Sporobolomyces koalae]|uniref:uncharacterized protein n=1 Tax=Sporobolomyces koalae TaxID=500713 RepID=UPI00316CEA0F